MRAQAEPRCPADRRPRFVTWASPFRRWHNKARTANEGVPALQIASLIGWFGELVRDQPRHDPQPPTARPARTFRCQAQWTRAAGSSRPGLSALGRSTAAESLRCLLSVATDEGYVVRRAARLSIGLLRSGRIARGGTRQLSCKCDTYCAQSQRGALRLGLTIASRCLQ